MPTVSFFLLEAELHIQVIEFKDMENIQYSVRHIDDLIQFLQINGSKCLIASAENPFLFFRRLANQLAWCAAFGLSAGVYNDIN